jgi:tRNA threonylcarbamoyladenosine biosynthesis protein TsaE
MVNLGSLVASFATPNLVIGLNGDLGAGKTVFTKGIGKYLGIKRVINSPTFTIMKIYDTNNSNIKKLYHLDVYRLDNSDEDFELEEYFYLDGLTVIEWSIIIEDILPKDMWNIRINIINENERLVEIEYNLDNNQLETALKEHEYEIIY